MLVVSSAERHGGAGSTPSHSAAPRGREMLVPCVLAPPVPTSALGSQQKGMLVPCVSPPLPFPARWRPEGRGMRVPGTLPPSPRSALGARGRGVLVHVHPVPSSPCSVGSKGKGTQCPSFPQQRTGDPRRRGCHSSLHIHTPFLLQCVGDPRGC